MADEKKYVGSDAALPRLWERVKALVANKANVITSGKMLSYSTEEQVVGRWIDGKPLYQVTIETTTGSKINALKEIDLPTDDIERISSINGIMTDSYGGYIPVSGAFVSNDTSTCVKIAYDVSKKVLTIWCSQTNWLNAKICITVTYTKTTDTAESEVFDPVAFINKPNLWEPGKEYDFGDGVYGQRYIGTYKSNATKYQMTQIVLETTWSGYQIIQCGGGIQYEPNAVLQLGFGGNNQDGERNTFSTGLYGFRGSTLGVNVQIAQVNQTYSYDVWLLYTKTS